MRLDPIFKLVLAIAGLDIVFRLIASFTNLFPSWKGSVALVGLIHFKNPDLFFGLLPTYLFQVIIGFFLIALLVGFYFQMRGTLDSRVNAFKICLVGAGLNWLEFLFSGKVTDYFAILRSIFNLADLMILYGFIWLVWLEANKRYQEYKNQNY